jgi:hypothetical protein
MLGALAVLLFQCLETASAAEAGGIFPRGRMMPFLGYSGDPARDLTNGFTVAGPVYGNQLPYLLRCFSNGWPVVAHIGPHITFNDKSPDKYKVNAVTLRAEVAKQVGELAPHPEIVWWAVTPEELRPWRKEEMSYLAIVTAAIREHDPLKRPVYLYNPNNRDAKTLEPIARQVDVLGKGCYVNSCGKKRDRSWVRWSVEQEVAALGAAGRAGAIPLLMPELCKDPEPSEDAEIRAWVRHDVYLGLASGAKGVLIWSLFKRKEVKRTWQFWYDAYAGCARELNGPRGLAQVFLRGERRATLQITPVKGGAAAAVALGGDAETGTTSAAEQARREIKMPSWTAAEYLHDGDTWLFLVNSANTPAAFTVSGWPAGARAQNAYDDAGLNLPAGAPLQLDLPPYGVTALRFTTTVRGQGK